MDAPRSRAMSRLCGLTGWLGVIVLQFTSFFMQVPLPASYEMFLVTCAALTGVEILEGIVLAFKRQNPKELVEEALDLPVDNTHRHHPGCVRGGAPTYEDLTGRLF